MKPRKQPSTKIWLGRRLVETEVDGVWCYVSPPGKPYEQIIIRIMPLDRHRPRGVKMWFVLYQIGGLVVRGFGSTEDHARSKVERELLWYRAKLQTALTRCNQVRGKAPRT